MHAVIKLFRNKTSLEVLMSNLRTTFLHQEYPLLQRHQKRLTRFTTARTFPNWLACSLSTYAAKMIIKEFDESSKCQGVRQGHEVTVTTGRGSAITVHTVLVSPALPLSLPQTSLTSSSV